MAGNTKSITFTYKHDASAGDIPAIVYFRPSEEASSPEPRPVVMIIHGGGYVGCGTFLIPRNQIEALLDRGFVVVAPEYRLCPQVSVVEGPITDMRDCLAWVQNMLPGLLQQQQQQQHSQTTGVAVDGKRVGVMGHSAGGNMSLVLGGEAAPPKAIFDIYGVIYAQRDFHHQPLAAFASLPDVPQDFIDKVFEGPVPITAPPMIKNGRPDVSTPRNAWMCTSLKKGVQMQGVVKDGNYEAMDGPAFFSKAFPPTCILHGTKDRFIPHEYSVDAIKELGELGVESELITVPDADHMFDMAITAEDPLFGYLQRGFDFLQKHV